MMEILCIFLQVSFFLIFFLFPLDKNKIEKYCNIKNISIYDTYIFNLLIYSSIFLLISFFKIRIDIFFYTILTIKILFVIFNYKKYSKYFADDDDIKYFIFFIVCLLAISFQIASDPKLGWDGIAHWYYKASSYFQKGTYEELKNLPLAYYPHLGPYIWNIFWSINPLHLEYYGRIFYIFIFIITIFSASNKLSKKIAFNTKLFITLILLTLTFDKFLISGYQEYLLFYLFYSSALIYNIKNKKNSEAIIPIIFLFLSSYLMFWIKQEGLFYLIILTIIFCFYYTKSILVKFIYTLSMLLLVWISIKIRVYFHGDFSLNEPILHSGLLKYLDLRIFINTFLLISWEIIKAIFKYPIWIVTCLCLLLSLKENKKINDINNIFLIVYFCLVYSIYFQTTMDIRELMPLTLDRVIFHGSSFFLIFIMEYLNKKLVKNSN